MTWLGECFFFLLSLGGKKFTEYTFIDSPVCGNIKPWLCLLKCFLSLKYGYPSITFKGRALPRQFGRRKVSQEQADSRSSLAPSSLPGERLAAQAPVSAALAVEHSIAVLISARASHGGSEQGSLFLSQVMIHWAKSMAASWGFFGRIRVVYGGC